MKKALRDPKDATHFFLLYANQTPGDILVREDLEAWAAAFQTTGTYQTARHCKTA